MSSPLDTSYNQNNSKDEKITVKKSTYKMLQTGLVAAIAIATFLGGYAIGTFDDNSNLSITLEDLDENISKTKSKPASIQPSQVPTLPPTQSSETKLSRFSIDDEPMKGDPNAPVTVIEFSDFQCPFCSRFSTQTLPLLEKYYVDTGEIKIIYKDFPLRIHSNARAAHIAAECAHEQGKFWEYHDILFLKQSQWQNHSGASLNSVLTNFATDLELETKDFQNCLNSIDISLEVDEDTVEAANNDAIGTPTFFIGNEKNGFTKLVGAQPYYVFADIIDEILES